MVSEALQLAGIGISSAIFPIMANYVKSIKKQRDSIEVKIEEELKKAVKATQSKVDDEVIEDITDSRLAIIHDYNLLFRAQFTNKWIGYALYYMTDESANLVNCDTDVMIFLNSICSAAGFGKMYQDIGSYPLEIYEIANPMYDIENCKFIINAKKLRQRLNDKEFTSKIRKVQKKESIKQLSIAKNEEKVETPKYFMPAFTIVNNSQPTANKILEKKGEGVDDELFQRLESVFGVLLSNDNYRYDCNNGIVTLSILSNNGYIINAYTVDYGNILGGTKISLLTYFNINGFMDSIFFDVNKHKEIANNVLRYNNISDVELNEVITDNFMNGTIYKYIDFSNTPWMDNLSVLDKANLEKRLSYIVEKLKDLAGVINDAPRLRFIDYRDTSNFILSSDKCVVSQLPGVTSDIIAEGLSIIMNDKSVSIINKTDTIIDEI